MLKYKLLALDIDDTLTKSPDRIPEENLQAIRKAQKAGIFVTIATGRGFLGSTPIWKLLDIRGPVINFGGAVIGNTEGEEPLLVESLAPELVLDTLETARELGVHAQIYQGDRVLFEKNCAYAERYCFYQKLPYRVVDDIRRRQWTDIPKVLYITEAQRAEELIPILAKRYEGKLKVSGSKAGFVELNKLGVDKASGLRHVAKLLNIPMSQTVAVGDNSLDVEMLSAAGLGAAIGDGADCVKQVADVILPPCLENGVAYLIEEILLKEEA